MKPESKKFIPYNKLSIAWKIVAYKHAKNLGYKGNKQISSLEFEIKDGKIIGCLDKYLLSDIFSI